MNVKNRTTTEHRLIRAIGEIIAEHGFAKMGVNAVARQAGVDKVLIYRYFGDLDGLIKAYANSTEFWPSAEEILGVEDAAGRHLEELRQQSFDQVYIDVLRRYAEAIRRRPLTLEILAWETIERNALTIALEEVRESFGLKMMALMSEMDLPAADWQAISTIFTSAIHYLAIRARSISYFNGVDLSNDQEWERLLDSMGFLITRTMEKHDERK